MGASGWSYFVEYQPDLQAALDDLRRHVLDTGDYWWAKPYELGTAASDFPDRPRTEEELWSDETVQECGTHSILDVSDVVTKLGDAGFGTVRPVTEAEALERAGVAKLTRDHLEAIQDLHGERWTGRCAVLHDQAGSAKEIFFWGISGD